MRISDWSSDVCSSDLGGADIIELGMPFTDPMADGPAIQAANLRSLAAGTKTADLLKIPAEFRARHSETPLVLMGYANPMTRRGSDWFAREAKAADRKSTRLNSSH